MTMKTLAASTALLFALGLTGCGEEAPETSDVTEPATGALETPEQEDAFAKQNSDPKGDMGAMEDQPGAGDMTAGEQRDRKVYGAEDESSATSSADAMPPEGEPTRQSGTSGATAGSGASGTEPKGEIGAFEEGAKQEGGKQKPQPKQAPQ